MYSFNEKVFLVNGACNSCFYDFNKRQLFHCSSDYAAIAKKIIENPSAELSIDERKKLQILLDAGLLIEAVGQISSGDIRCLKRKISVDFAWIELTNQCNMRCMHCYDESCITNKEYLSLDDYKYVIDELVEYGVRSVQLIGGEPLLVKNIQEMVLYAMGKMHSITIFTNASLITEELASFFAKYHINIAVSVYSYNEIDHDYVTKVPGSHRLTIQGLKLLKKYKVSYRIATVLMDGVNQGSSDTDLYSLGKGDVVRLSGRADGHLLNEELIVRKLITQKNFHTKLDEEFSSRCVSGHNCFCRRLYISSDMNVYPCVMERRLCHGNLKDGHLKDIVKKEILDFNKDNIKICKDCEFRYTCFDCRPNSIEKGPNEKPWYCTYDPYSGKWETIEAAVNRIFRQMKIQEESN